MEKVSDSWGICERCNFKMPTSHVGSLQTEANSGLALPSQAPSITQTLPPEDRFAPHMICVVYSMALLTLRKDPGGNLHPPELYLLGSFRACLLPSAAKAFSLSWMDVNCLNSNLCK